MWIPDEICSSILSRLPVRDVLACRCVCKDWLNLISTPDFVQMHLRCHRQNSNSNSLMLGCLQQGKSNIYSIDYNSLALILLPQLEAEEEDDDSLSRSNNNNNCNYNVVQIEEEDSSSTSNGSEIDKCAVQMNYPFKFLGLMVDLFGSCNGCVCLWFHDDHSDDREEFFCLWNPATRQYKRMSPSPKRYDYSDIKLYALVYDPTAEDYKFLIAVSSDSSEMSSLVHVYTLKSDSWKTFVTPDYFVSAQKPGVLFNGDLHWLTLNSIVSLDIGNEKFRNIQPPPLKSLTTILVAVLDECLCVLVEDDQSSAFEIWAMQGYGDPNSWTKHYTVTHEIITTKIPFQVSDLRFMWSSKNGVVLFTHSDGLVLYDPEHGSAIESPVGYVSVENYSESLVSLNSYVGGSAYAELQILRSRNSVLESRNGELEARNTELEASNAELQRNLQEFQVAEQRVDSQKEAEGVRNMKKKKLLWPREKRKTSKAVAAIISSPRESTNFEDESLTGQQRAEKEHSKRVPLSCGGTLKPYQSKERSKTHSPSEDL